MDPFYNMEDLLKEHSQYGKVTGIDIFAGVAFLIIMIALILVG